MKPFTIIQISDLHIAEEGEHPYEVDVRGNFLAVMDDLASQRMDLLVITGDLCYRAADERIYAWIRDKIDKLDIPYRVLPGNHDDPDMLAESFQGHTSLREDGIFFFEEFTGFGAFFMDSSTNTVPEKQLQWLAESGSGDRRRTLFFLHHPPALCGVPYMDNKYALENRDTVQAAFLTASRQPVVFCGHYHVPKICISRGMPIFLSPATFFQIDEDTEAFRPAHHMPGYRKTRIYGDKIESSVKYIV